jgi:hypothetical protein
LKFQDSILKDFYGRASRNLVIVEKETWGSVLTIRRANLGSEIHPSISSSHAQNYWVLPRGAGLSDVELGNEGAILQFFVNGVPRLEIEEIGRDRSLRAQIGPNYGHETLPVQAVFCPESESSFELLFQDQFFH